MNIYVTRCLVPFHVLFVASLYLYSFYEWYYAVGLLVAWILIGGFGLEVGYHRLLSHRSFETKHEKLLSLLGCLGLNGSPLFWASLHRGYHHPHADTAKDFHSPINGFWRSYVVWVNDIRDSNFSFKYAGKEMVRSKFHQALQKHYYKGLWIFSVLMACISWKLFFFSILPAMIFTYHQTALVNVLCHSPKFIGYRTHDTNDRSTNVRWLSFFTWGLALHNNHHKHPRNTNFAGAAGEHDPGFLLVRLVQKVESRNVL